MMMKKNKKLFFFLATSVSIFASGGCSNGKGDYRNNTNYSDYVAYVKKGGAKNYWEWAKEYSPNGFNQGENFSEVVVTSGRIDSNGHLILNFSSGKEVDAGEIGLRRFQSFNVKFFCGNLRINAAKVRFGQLANEPKVKGIKIQGWFKDSSFSRKWDFDVDRVYGPMNLYAKFMPNKTTVRFKNGFSDYLDRSLEFSLPYSLPEPIHPKLELTFDGWYFGNKKVDMKGIWNISHSNVTLEARWKKRETINVRSMKEGIDFVYFGRYPQSVVSDENLAQKIKDKNQKNAAGNYEYEGREYDDRTTSLESPSVSRYFNDGTKIVDKKLYLYRVEPIKWRLLKKNHDGTALFISEDVIDCTFAIVSHQTHRDKNAYPKNMLRAWLNGKFYDTYTNDYRGNSMQNNFHFLPLEKKAMLNVYEEDKFSLLTKEECEKYFHSDKERIARYTDYAKATRAVVDFGENSSWWTKNSPTGYTNISVSPDGSFSELISDAHSGIRPIIKLKVDE